MNVLILGSGGREHALAWKLKQSPLCDLIYMAPGNAGTLDVAHNIDVSPLDFNSIIDVIEKFKIDLLLVGPEEPLVNGICDHIQSVMGSSSPILIGPHKKSAMLEGSKAFSKSFMRRYNIPTADFLSFSEDSYSEALIHLDNAKPPYVIKADGLAMGKGVIITQDVEQAKFKLKSFFDGSLFGSAGKKVLIEDFLHGKEFSVFLLLDGLSWKMLPAAVDFKYAENGNTGLLTGGMASISPPPFFTQSFKKKIVNEVVMPTIEGMKREGLMYTGFLYIGMINVSGRPMVLEYNVRMGDPETQCVLPLMKSDLLSLLLSAAKQKLSSRMLINSKNASSALVLASEGYPKNYKLGYPISGLENTKGTYVFHAGTRLKGKIIETDGGRVLTISAIDDKAHGAMEKVMKVAECINFKGKIYRTDIG